MTKEYHEIVKIGKFTLPQPVLMRVSRKSTKNGTCCHYCRKVIEAWTSYLHDEENDGKYCFGCATTRTDIDIMSGIEDLPKHPWEEPDIPDFQIEPGEELTKVFSKGGF